jgi:hypothetical protein
MLVALGFMICGDLVSLVFNGDPFTVFEGGVFMILMALLLEVQTLAAGEVKPRCAHGHAPYTCNIVGCRHYVPPMGGVD